jgi:ATP-binding cassette, subfamily B, bacterial CvaB/MchF/RaxB
MNKVKIVYQGESSECGLACLAMVASYHGQPWTLAQLRSRFNPSLRGLHLGGLIGIARSIGLPCRALRTEPELLSALALPAILHWDMNHFVVLERINGEKAILQDPKLGQRVVSLAELRQRFTGVALELSPPAGQATQAPERLAGNSIFGWLGVFKGFASSVWIVLFLSIALEVATLLTPAFLQTVVDSSIPNTDVDLLSVLAIAFGLLALMQFALAYARSSAISEISFRLHHHWANKLFGHLIHLPTDFFQRRHVGDVVSRFRAIDKIQRVVSAVGIEVFTDAVVSILLVIVMASYSPLLTTLAISGLVLNIALRISALTSMRSHSEAGAVASAREVSSFLETIRTSVVIRLLGLENRRRDLWANAYIDAANANVQVQRLSVLSTGITNLVTNIEQIAVVWVGARAAMNGELSVGMLLAFLAYRGILMIRSRSILEKAVEFRLLGVDCDRLQDIVDQKQIQNVDMAGAPGPQRAARIEFVDVSFRYSESEPWVLRNLSFTIEPGDSVAFGGVSRCG